MQTLLLILLRLRLQKLVLTFKRGARQAGHWWTLQYAVLYLDVLKHPHPVLEY
jgi:hypothetical protein